MERFICLAIFLFWLSGCQAKDPNSNWYTPVTLDYPHDRKAFTLKPKEIVQAPYLSENGAANPTFIYSASIECDPKALRKSLVFDGFHTDREFNELELTIEIDGQENKRLAFSDNGRIVIPFVNPTYDVFWNTFPRASGKLEVSYFKHEISISMKGFDMAHQQLPQECQLDKPWDKATIRQSEEFISSLESQLIPKFEDHIARHFQNEKIIKTQNSMMAGREVTERVLCSEVFVGNAKWQLVLYDAQEDRFWPSAETSGELLTDCLRGKPIVLRRFLY